MFYICFRPPKWATLFWPRQMKNVSFSSLFALKKFKNTFPPDASLKHVCNVCWFKGNTQNILRPCEKLKSNIKELNFGIGVLKQFGTACIMFFSKIAPPCLCFRKSIMCCWEIMVLEGTRVLYKEQTFFFRENIICLKEHRICFLDDRRYAVEKLLCFYEIIWCDVLKGQCHEIFCHLFISWKEAIWGPW